MTDRLSLWYKLLQSGVDGKKFLRPMYDEVKLCVKHMNMPINQLIFESIQSQLKDNVQAQFFLKSAS